ncbi:MAG: recombinase family protein, partial [Evtepia sp.]|nr:recombinase family protein [Evtepia sp.]
MAVMKFGYARVSTDDQELARQIDALNNYGVDKIYKEKITGTKASRPELDKLKNAVREGDSVIIESLSRLGRSTKDLLALLEEWDNQGVKLVSLKENIDTTTPTGKLLVTVLSAISQFERDITVQRTNEGLQAARQRGRKGGRPKANAENVRKAVDYYNRQTMSVKEITAICGISQATLYRALNEAKTAKSE